MAKEKDILAKSNCKTLNETLSNHTKMVVNFTYNIVNKLYCDNVTINKSRLEKMLKHATLAACLHDIGKIETNNQKVIEQNNKGEDKIIKHNVLSWYYACYFINGLNKKNMYHIGGAILNHHPYNDNFTERKLYDTIHKQINEYDSFYTEMCDYVKDTFNIDLKKDFGINSDNEYDVNIDNYSIHMKSYEQNFANMLECADNNFIRLAVLTADRKVSSIQSDDKDKDDAILSEILKNNTALMDSMLFDYIHSENIIRDYSNLTPEMFSDRYDTERIKTQIDCVLNCEKNQTTIVNASAGSGKTLIGLLWYLHSREKVIWVNTRNVINSSAYMSITGELEKLGETSVKVCQINGNRIQNHNFAENNFSDGYYIENSDIIVINIDSLLNWNIINSLEHNIIRTCTSRIIFDEFHEMVCSEPLFSAFVNLLWTRCFNTKAKTLLLSATPIDLTCFNLGSDVIKTNHDIPVINGDMKVNIAYLEVDDVQDIYSHIKETDTFVKLSTIPNAQSLFGMFPSDTTTLLHSLFTEKDRTELENHLYLTHGKTSDINQRALLIATSLLTTGLDVSARNMLAMAYGMEDAIQAMGRNGRFGEYPDIRFTHVVLKNDRFVSKVYDKNLYKLWNEKWKNFVKQNNGITTKSEIYRLMDDFKNENADAFEAYWKRCFHDSETKAKELKSRKTYKNKGEDTKILSSTLNYRGENSSMFVTAKMNDGTYSDPIIIDRIKLSIDKLYDYKSEIVGYFKENYNLDETQKWKYVKKNNAGKNNFSNLMEYLLHFSLDEEKPFPLPENIAKYNSKNGLTIFYDNQND